MNSVLHEILPRKVRLWIYVLVFVALLVLSAVQANEGNVVAAITSVLSSLAPLLAAGNLPRPIEGGGGDHVLVEVDTPRDLP